jgi:hypothetical protein
MNDAPDEVAAMVVAAGCPGAGDGGIVPGPVPGRFYGQVAVRGVERDRPRASALDGLQERPVRLDERNELRCCRTDARKRWFKYAQLGKKGRSFSR